MLCIMLHYITHVTCVHMCAYTHVHVHVRVHHVDIYMYAHTRTHVHTYTHTCATSRHEDRAHSMQHACTCEAATY